MNLLPDALSITASAWCTSFSTRCRRLDSRLAVGFGILDTRASFAALVLWAGGRAASAVFDLVLRAGAVGGTLIGLDTIRRLCFTIRRGLTGNCAVVGCTLGVGACTLGAGVGVVGVPLLAMDLVVRMSAGTTGLSTLGAGCVSGAGVWSDVTLFVSFCAFPNLSASRCMSRMSCSALALSMPLMALTQSASAFMILS